MKIEVSFGEAIDKLSILELKMVKITDESKKTEIQKEINCLTECQPYKVKYELYYTMLMYVNEKIWDFTDMIKSITPEHPQFASISNQIFEFNQKRFRIKNWFNLLTNSTLKEQKSYTSNGCVIIVENEETFFNKLPEIHYLALEYDFITFQSPIQTILHDFLKIPTLLYEENKIFKTIHLSDTNIPTESREVFCLKPITYVIGGMFGDFIQCLSIIQEKFYETGRKGILYISNRGDTFRNGLENTYHDTYPVIIQQSYIQEYKLWNNEPYDIDLTSWRNSLTLFKQNWYCSFSQWYHVEWGKRKWLKVPYDDTWKNKIVINTTNYRWAYSVNFTLLQQLGSELVFVASDKQQHDFFENKTNIKVKYYECTSFLELTTIIHSCKLFVGSISGPLCIAHALHKDRICGLTENLYFENVMTYGLNTIFKNLRYHV